MSPPALSSNVITWRRAGHSPRIDATLAVCSASDVKIATAPESRRM
jgi:hypothetical protein